MIKNKIALEFITATLDDIRVKELEDYSDQGVRVTTHIYDVLQILWDKIVDIYKNIESANEKLDLFSIVLGVILHDLSKRSLRKNNEKISHSQIMLKRPEYIIKETDIFLKDIEKRLNVQLLEEVRKHIIHIVVSHHGKWGKVQPNTREARLVHEADMYSAKYHRINPITANNILQSMVEGLTWDEIAKRFDCTIGVIKDRLRRAKFELKVKTTKQLLNYYKNKKRVPIGDKFFSERVMQTGRLIKDVEKHGFKKLVLKLLILECLEDSKIFREN